MTKLQLLHRALNERLMAAVEQIMEMVGGTVLEYEEETVRARKENEVLKRRLRWMGGETPTDWPDDVDTTGLEQTVVGVDDSVENRLLIKIEPADVCDPPLLRPDTSLVTSVCSTDLETVHPETTEATNSGVSNGLEVDSSHSYMAPLDFDPTENWKSRNRSQRMSFACPDCGKVFGREQTLIFHMRIHSAERPYVYRRRKECFYGEKTRQKKLHAISKLSKEFVESDTSEEELSNNSATVSALMTTAPNTGRRRHSQNSAEKPVSKQTSVKANMLQCLVCKIVFKKRRRLAMHMKVHQKPLDSQKEQGSNEEMDKKSQKPPETKENPKEMVAENSSACALKKIFKCPHCDKVFSREGWLVPHIRSHTNQTTQNTDLLSTLPPKRNNRQTVSQLSKEFVDLDSDTSEEELSNNSATVSAPMTTAPNTGRRRHSENSAEKPVSKQTPVKANMLQCLECKRVFKKMRQLAMHMKVHQKSQKPPERPKEASDEGKLQIERIIGIIESETRNPSESKTDLESKSKRKESRVAEESTEESTEGARGTKRSKKSCRECGKVYVLPGCLRSHERAHTNERIQKQQQKRKIFRERRKTRAQEHNFRKLLEKRKNMISFDISQTKKQNLEVEVSSNVRAKKKTSDVQAAEDKSRMPLLKKYRFKCERCSRAFPRKNSLDLHMYCHKRKDSVLEETLNEETQKSDDAQTPQKGSSTDDSTPENKKEGDKAAHTCPFCDKVFRRGMRLMLHMQIHSCEKPYSYRHRKEQFYGDLTKPKVQDTSSQEPAIKSSDWAGRFAVTRSHASVSQDHTSATEPMESIQPQSVCSGRTFSLLPLQSSGGASGHKKHFSLQPRIVLKPVTAIFKSWASPGDGHLRSDSTETSAHELLKTSGENPANGQPLKNLLENTKTSDADWDDSPDLCDNFEETDSEETVMEVKTAESTGGHTEDTETRGSSSKRGSKCRPSKKEIKAMHCGFCGKACRKIERHLKYDHPKEPEVIEALRFGKTSEERKQLLSRLCSMKYSESDAHEMSSSDKAHTLMNEDLVHCIFCQGSYRRGQFWKHALICEQKKTEESTPSDDANGAHATKTSSENGQSKMQKALDPEAEKPIKDTTCNTAQETLPESLKAPAPEVDPSTTENNLCSATPGLESGSTNASERVESKSSCLPTLDPQPSPTKTTPFPSVETRMAENPDMDPPVLHSNHRTPEITPHPKLDIVEPNKSESYPYCPGPETFIGEAQKTDLETGNPSIPMSDHSKHPPSLESGCSPVLGCVPSETQQPPDLELDPNHLGENVVKNVEHTGTDSQFESACTEVVKRKWDNQGSEFRETETKRKLQSDSTGDTFGPE